MNGSLSGTCKSGFSLIEIMIAIAIMAIFASILIPNLTKRNAKQEREAFVRNLNALTQGVWTQAQISNKTQRITVDLGKKRISVATLTGQKDPKGEPITMPLKGVSFATTLPWPENLVIKNFFLEGFDEMARFTGRKTEEIWFYIMPGFTQSVIINMVDTNDMESENKARQFSLVLNPFSAQFELYDTFQKP